MMIREAIGLYDPIYGQVDMKDLGLVSSCGTVQMGSRAKNDRAGCFKGGRKKSLILLTRPGKKSCELFLLIFFYTYYYFSYYLFVNIYPNPP